MHRLTEDGMLGVRSRDLGVGDGVMSGPRSLRVVELSEADRATLASLTRRTTVAAGLARRAQIVLLAAEGEPLERIARQLGVDRNVVRRWIDRYRAGGL